MPKRLVSLHDTIVLDGGTKVGLGVPFLISHARRRPKIREELELRHESWRLGAAQTDTSALERKLVQDTLDDPPYVLALSLQAWSHAFFLNALREIKRARPEVVTVVGGPTASDLGTELLEQVPEIDFLVQGFGEHAFADLLEALLRQGSWDSIAGLCHRDDGGRPRRSRAVAAVLDPLDECGAPLQEGLVPALGEQTLLNVEWTRGCPFSCAYCSWAMGQKKLTRFSDDYVARDIACALDAGLQELLVCDPAINFATRHLRSLVEVIERADPDRRIGFHAFLQYSCIDEEQAELLARVRFNRLMVGLQTDDAEGLAALNRPRFARDEFEAAIRRIARAHAPTVDLMTGVPGDTPEKIRERVRYVLDLGATVAIFPLLALPGSGIWRRRAEFGLDVDESRFHVVRSLPTLSEAAYREVARELQAMSDAGAKIEVAGYSVLFGRESPLPGGRADSGEQVSAWLDRVLERLGRVAPATQRELGIDGFRAEKKQPLKHADCQAIRLVLRSGEQRVEVDVFDARHLSAPRNRGDRLAFLPASGAALADRFCAVLARLDRAQRPTATSQR